MLSYYRDQSAYMRSLRDGILLVAAFALAYWARSYFPLPFMGQPSPLSIEAHFWMPAIALPLYWLLERRKNGKDHRRKAESVQYRLIAVAVTFIYLGLSLSTAIFLLQAKNFSRSIFILFLVFGFVFISTSRLFGRSRSRVKASSRQARRNVLIIGVGPNARMMHEKIEADPTYRMSVVGHLAGPAESVDASEPQHVLGDIKDLRTIVERCVIDEVIFCLPPSDLISCEQQIAWCEEVGITVHLKIDFIQTLFARTFPSDLDGTPILTVCPIPHDPLRLLIKRGIDITVSTAVLIVLSPLLLLIALAVYLGSPGPAIFKQERLGLNGRVFNLFKFRSMHVDAERQRVALERLNKQSGPVFKLDRDPRVTALGRWLRKFSLDELPQLLNVLQGDMSLVGPRPPLANEVDQYQRWQRRRLSMKPGITCLWQVSGRNRITFVNWMKLDLEYIDNWSLLLDLKILLRTIPAVLLAKGVK
jgi:exopolysaccharide biosynthesis polyprenyl glycosylphosphotransferase